jgi:hypothetical protein
MTILNNFSLAYELRTALDAAAGKLYLNESGIQDHNL